MIGRWMIWATSPSPTTPTRSLLNLLPFCTDEFGSATGGERRVERRLRWLDRCERSDERERVGGTVLAIHAGVLPLDADRPAIADRVQHPEDRLPRHVPVTGRDEVPAAARVSPRQVGAQPAVAPVELLDRLLAVDVVDPRPVVPQEGQWVEVLPHEVAGVEVEPEGLAVADRLHRPVGGPVVVGDLAGVDL